MHSESVSTYEGLVEPPTTLSHASSSSVYVPLDHVGLSTFRVANQTSGKATEEEAEVVGGLLVLQFDIFSRASPITPDEVLGIDVADDR